MEFISMPFLRSATSCLMSSITAHKGCNHCLPAHVTFFFFLSYPRSIGTTTAALISPCLFPSFFFSFQVVAAPPSEKKHPGGQDSSACPAHNKYKKDNLSSGRVGGSYIHGRLLGITVLCKGQYPFTKWTSSPMDPSLQGWQVLLLSGFFGDR